MNLYFSAKKIKSLILERCTQNKSISIFFLLVVLLPFSVYFVQELLAEKVQLYGVDVDSIIQELQKTKNQLRAINQVDVDDLNNDELVSLLDGPSRYDDPVSQRLRDEHANRDALNQILNYYSKPRHEHVKKSRLHHEYDDLQRLLNLVNKSNKLKSESTVSEQESTLNKPKIYVLDMENLRNMEM